MSEMQLSPTDEFTQRYQGIAKAALCVAYDNGMINREITEERFMADVVAVCNTPKWRDKLIPIDMWLYALSDEQMGIVCCGESVEMDYATKFAPEGTNDLLDDIFEGDIE